MAAHSAHLICHLVGQNRTSPPTHTTDTVELRHNNTLDPASRVINTTHDSTVRHELGHALLDVLLGSTPGD
ncbi:MAG: hypothetical protein R2857_15495 [Vampirovibrionales bacterium]